MPEMTLFDLDLKPADGLAAPAGPEGSSNRTASARARTHTGPRRPTALVVDGNSLAYRAFHAYQPDQLTDEDGRPLGAIYGFLALLSGICDRVGPDAIVIGFDCRKRSTRRDRFPGYKAQRPDKDPLLLMQISDLTCLLERLGVPVVCPEGWEADDVLGSGAQAAEDAGWQCVLATSDRDAFALLSPTTTLLRLGSGLDSAREVTPAHLTRTVGVNPKQYTEFAALRGDTSDNLPGIPGIGAKRAAALLREYPTVADAIDDPLGCRSVLGRPLGQALLNDLADPERSVFHRNVALMTIRRDLPIDLEAGRPSATPDDVERHLLAWQLPTLVRRVTVALGVRPDLPPHPGDEYAPPE